MLLTKECSIGFDLIIEALLIPQLELDRHAWGNDEGEEIEEAPKKRASFNRHDQIKNSLFRTSNLIQFLKEAGRV